MDMIFMPPRFKFLLFIYLIFLSVNLVSISWENIFSSFLPFFNLIILLLETTLRNKCILMWMGTVIQLCNLRFWDVRSREFQIEVILSWTVSLKPGWVEYVERKYLKQNNNKQKKNKSVFLDWARQIWN